MNVIFVCTGNTCRSPMAEYYLKSKNLDNLNVSSRGFGSGEDANPNAICVMYEAGIGIGAHLSKVITQDDVKTADLIICMTDFHKQQLVSLGVTPNKLLVLGGGIADPFGGDLNVYRKCRDDIFAAVDTLINNGVFAEVVIDFATTDDVADIANIEKLSFSDPWSENSVKESMNAGTTFYVAKLAGKTVGYMGLSKIVGEGYVTNVAVLPEYRRKGIGKKILDFAINDSKDELEFISLEVRVSNTPAITLYENLGFLNVGTRKRFYTNPCEDAYIMTKNFI